MNSLIAMKAWAKARINERSTWIIVGASSTAASQLTMPWNWIAFAVGVIGGLVPDGKIKP